MAVVSEAVTASVEKALARKPLRIKFLAKKPVITAVDFSKKEPISNSVASGAWKFNTTIIGTKRRLEESEEREKEKRLKMDRFATSNCKVTLGKLIKHRFSFPFKKPVDPVELCIPDYFDIIKNPMDLGTIKQKLDDNKYRDVEAFESDVRLTFSNALLYNSPDNFVHQYAKELMTCFDHLWKPVKAKMNRQFEGIKQISIQNVADEAKPDGDKKRMKNFSCQPVKLPGQTSLCDQMDPGELREISSQKKVKVKRPSEDMKQLSTQKIGLRTNDVSQKCLESLSSNVCNSSVQKMSCNRKDCKDLTEISNKKDEEINGLCKSMKHVISQKIDDGTTLDARGECLKFSGFYLDKLSTQDMLSNVKDPKELTEASFKKRKVQMKGMKNSEISTATPVDSVLSVKSAYAKESMQARNPHDEIKVFEVKNNSAPLPCRSVKNTYGKLTCSEEDDTSCATASGDATIEGLETILDIQLSPSKALRAAKLKSRFADTILKAQHKTLLQSGCGTDSMKLQQEKERLERKQREEKAKIESQIRAAERAARVKAESELKNRREQERIALEKMEQSVGLDDNFHVLRELESLIGRPLFVLCKCRDGRSQAAYMWDKAEAEELRSPLEQLGLFIKTDDEAMQDNVDCEEGELVF